MSRPAHLLMRRGNYAEAAGDEVRIQLGQSPMSQVAHIAGLVLWSYDGDGLHTEDEAANLVIVFESLWCRSSVWHGGCGGSQSICLSLLYPSDGFVL